MMARAERPEVTGIIGPGGKRRHDMVNVGGGRVAPGFLVGVGITPAELAPEVPIAALGRSVCYL